MRNIIKTNYNLLSSMTGGLNETYNTFEEMNNRLNYIKNHKQEFINNSMIYARKNEYYERDDNTYLEQTTLEYIDLKEVQ